MRCSLKLACYDQAKQLVLGTGVMGDNVLTHFLSSFIAVSIMVVFDFALTLGVRLVFSCAGFFFHADDLQRHM